MPTSDPFAPDSRFQAPGPKVAQDTDRTLPIRTPSGFVLENGARPGPLAELADRGELPADWYKRSLAAYLHGLGQTAEQCARGAGVSVRTFHRWKSDETWAVFRQCSEDLWLVDVLEAARLAVLRAIAEGDTGLAMKVLERKVPGLADRTAGSVPQGAGPSVGVFVGLPPADTGSRADGTLIELPAPEDR